MINKRTTRDHIVEAANQLFYEHGFEHTSFSDIANQVQISRGNFYYHFKTKDEILAAVIQLRLANTARILAEWEQKGESPKDRIRCFILILVTNRVKIKQFGCPVGTLSSELAKLNHVAQKEANEIFTLFRCWLRTQFSLLGHKSNADALAMHVLGRSQGVATLVNAFKDEKYLQQEVKQLCEWLDSITDE